VLAERRKQLRKREAALKLAAAMRPTVRRASAQPPARAMRAVGSATSAGVLVAEGDSWFDYPRRDILKALEDTFGYDVETVARAGDRVENMAYADGQLDGFVRRIEKVVRSGRLPRAILLSGGGNDIAGKAFHMFLNHAGSPSAGINESVARGVIDERIREAYVDVIAIVTELCRRVAGTVIPIVVHGYDHPVPDGRGFAGGFAFLPGPWLEPGFRDKGFTNKSANTALIRTLIDRFNAMLGGVAALQGFEHVRYADLRGTLTTGAKYRDVWANELHPTPRGFDRVTAKFAAAIP
jgi:lysophospholipase L1-like esterase